MMMKMMRGKGRMKWMIRMTGDDDDVFTHVGVDSDPLV